MSYVILLHKAILSFFQDTENQTMVLTAEHEIQGEELDLDPSQLTYT